MLTQFIHGKSILTLFTFLALMFFTIESAQAGPDEMALFFDELTPYGEWVDFKQYGPVWYPTQNVDKDSWRPYVDGRWVPSDKGWVFETAEPWGWATYHFGNWMPTEEYGWVWVPGATWYPSTVTWRISPKKGAEAVGWAPVPPPDYNPEPAFMPAAGFPADTPAQGKLIPAMYVFTPGPAFLQGEGQPYNPEYSYQNTGEMLPPEQIPELYPTTELVGNFVAQGPDTEAVANWGPPLDQVSQVTGVSPMALYETTAGTNVMVLENCWPPPVILSRRAYFGYLLPGPNYVVRPLPSIGRRGYYYGHLYGRGHLHGHPGFEHVNFPHPPQKWPPPRPVHPKFSAAAFSQGHHPHFLDLPPNAINHAGIKRIGGPMAGPFGKGPVARPNDHLHTRLGALPIGSIRRAKLEQNRAQMAEQKKQIQQAKLEAGPKGPPAAKPVASPVTTRKTWSSSRGSHTLGEGTIARHGGHGTAQSLPRPIKPTPIPGFRQSLTSVTPKTTGTPKPLVHQPFPPPKTAEDFRREREARQQAEAAKARQQQQSVSTAGPHASPSVPAPHKPGEGMAGSTSLPTTKGPTQPGSPAVSPSTTRAPKTAGYLAPATGSAGSPPASGGFGLKPGAAAPQNQPGSPAGSPSGIRAPRTAGYGAQATGSTGSPPASSGFGLRPSAAAQQNQPASPSGSPGSPKPGVFGPKPGGGSGPAPMVNQPSGGSTHGGGMQQHPGTVQKVQAPKPNTSSGGGKKSPPPAKDQKKKQ